MPERTCLADVIHPVGWLSQIIYADFKKRNERALIEDGERATARVRMTPSLGGSLGTLVRRFAHRPRCLAILRLTI